jgi:hypothetical protein
MPHMDEFKSGGAPGISSERLNEPFHLKSMVYDSVNNKIDLTLGRGRAVFLDIIVEKNADSTYYIAAPAINTTYYVYLKSDGTYTSNTTGTSPAGSIKIWAVATGATVDALTKSDLRALIDGSGRKAQDNLDAHVAAADPHPQYETSAEAQAKANTAEANAKAASVLRTTINVNNFDTINENGFYDGNGATGAPTASTWYYVEHNEHSSDGIWAVQRAWSFFDEKLSYIRFARNSNGSRVWTAWFKQWHSGNDGSGSTMDADTVDGKHASDFATSADLPKFYVAGDTILLEALTEESTQNNADTELKRFYLRDAGRYRITGEARRTGNATATVKVKYTNNNVMVNTGSFQTISDTYVAFTIDMNRTVMAAGEIQVTLNTDNVSFANFIRNVRVRGIEGTPVASSVLNA